MTEHQKNTWLWTRLAKLDFRKTPKGQTKTWLGDANKADERPKDFLKAYVKKFDADEIEVLRKVYEELSARNLEPGIDRATFLQYFQLPGLWGERLFQRFDYKSLGYVDFEELLVGIAVCCRGTRSEKFQVLFQVFDLNGDGILQKNELVTMLSNLPHLERYIRDSAMEKVECDKSSQSLLPRDPSHLPRQKSVASAQNPTESNLGDPDIKNSFDHSIGNQSNVPPYWNEADTDSTSKEQRIVECVRQDSAMDDNFTLEYIPELDFDEFGDEDDDDENDADDNDADTIVPTNYEIYVSQQNPTDTRSFKAGRSSTAHELSQLSSNLGSCLSVHEKNRAALANGQGVMSPNMGSQSIDKDNSMKTNSTPISCRNNLRDKIPCSGAQACNYRELASATLRAPFNHLSNAKSSPLLPPEGSVSKGDHLISKSQYQADEHNAVSPNCQWKRTEIDMKSKAPLLKHTRRTETNSRACDLAEDDTEGLDVEGLVDKIIEECEFSESNSLTLMDFKTWLEKNDAIVAMFSECLHEEAWGIQGNALYRSALLSRAQQQTPSTLPGSFATQLSFGNKASVGLSASKSALNRCRFKHWFNSLFSSHKTTKSGQLQMAHLHAQRQYPWLYSPMTKKVNGARHVIHGSHATLESRDDTLYAMKHLFMVPASANIHKQNSAACVSFNNEYPVPSALATETTTASTHTHQWSGSSDSMQSIATFQHVNEEDACRYPPQDAGTSIQADGSIIKRQHRFRWRVGRNFPLKNTDLKVLTRETFPSPLIFFPSGIENNRSQPNDKKGRASVGCAQESLPHYRHSRLYPPSSSFSGGVNKFDTQQNLGSSELDWRTQLAKLSSHDTENEHVSKSNMKCLNRGARPPKTSVKSQLKSDKTAGIKEQSQISHVHISDHTMSSPNASSDTGIVTTVESPGDKQPEFALPQRHTELQIGQTETNILDGGHDTLSATSEFYINCPNCGTVFLVCPRCQKPRQFQLRWSHRSVALECAQCLSEQPYFFYSCWNCSWMFSKAFESLLASERVIEGYLSKVGRHTRKRRKRYYILIDNLLYYYNKKEDLKPQGFIFLEECFVEAIPSHKQPAPTQCEARTQHLREQNKTSVFFQLPSIPVSKKSHKLFRSNSHRTLGGNSSKKYFGFSIIHGHGKLPRRDLYAASEQERTEWISALRQAMKQQNIEDLYGVQELIGQGKFSVVHKAKVRNDHENNPESILKNQMSIISNENDDITASKQNEFVAIKYIEKSKITDHERELLRSEIAILRLLQHPHVIKFREILDTQTAIHLVMEYVEGGELYYVLQNQQRLPESQVNRIIFQLLSTVAYLHSCGIIHRDLKPENILLTSKDSDADIKITDFGLSCICGPNELVYQPCGTLAYVAPEVLTLQGYNHKADVWSVGVIMYLLLRGRLPFPIANRRMIGHAASSIHHQPLSFEGPIWDNVCQSAKDLLRRLLQTSAEKRISAQEALQHIWLKNPTAVMKSDDITVTRPKPAQDKIQSLGFNEKYYRPARSLQLSRVSSKTSLSNSSDLQSRNVPQIIHHDEEFENQQHSTEYLNRNSASGVEFLDVSASTFTIPVPK